MLIDVRCPKCGKTYEDKIIFNENEDVICPDCNVNCNKLKSFDSTFRLKYDNKKDLCSWGAEGYSKSRYWEAQDKLAKGNIFPVTK